MKYNYYVIWSQDDNEFVGLCKEFPSLSWLAVTDEDALNGIENLVIDIINETEN